MSTAAPSPPPSVVDRLLDTVQAAADGDLSRRLVGVDPDDPLAPICDAVNDLLDRIETSTREAVGAIEAAETGAFHRRCLARGLGGAFEATANAVNAVIDRASERAAEVEALQTERQALADRFHDDVATIATTLASASTELDATAVRLHESADAAVLQTEEARAASASATEDASAVARSMRAMTVSVREVGDQAAQTAASVAAAANAVQAAGTQMTEIREASTAVEDVVTFIQRVARQTNLLALNAAVEASRAGDAGRGFAVVAAEVKKLATQVADASRDIRDRAGRVRQATDHGIDALGQIEDRVREVEQATATIEAAIARQVDLARAVAEDADHAVEQGRSALQSMVVLAENATAVASCAHDIARASHEIVHHADRLTVATDGFLDQVKA